MRSSVFCFAQPSITVNVMLSSDMANAAFDQLKIPDQTHGIDQGRDI